MGLAVLLLGAGGTCAPGAAGDRPALRSGTIIGGTVDTTHNAVLALIQYETATRGFACSGTAIAQSGTSALLLTAAHCVLRRDAMDQVIQPMTIASPSVLTVVPGPDWQASLAQAGNFTVAAVSVAPGYDGAADSPNDIAVVRFTTSAPALPVIPILEAADDALAVGSMLTLVGYGVTMVGGQNSVRHTLDLPIDSLDAQHLFYLQNDMKGQCGGDSGGPALIRVGGAERVAGVISYSLELPSLNLFCTLQGASVRVSPFASFIHSIVGGGTPPDAGTNDAGATDGRAADAVGPDAARDASAGGGDAVSAPDAASDGAPGGDGPGPDSSPALDAGGTGADAATLPDAGADQRAQSATDASGCGCSVGSRSTWTSIWGALVGLLALLRTRRRPRPAAGRPDPLPPRPPFSWSQPNTRSA